jgi:serine kinase of HPr protein (carbohydrate metabolism regulator)
VILHAGMIALRSNGLWKGALIAGPSGAGKSDLMLRALDAGFRLVADDRTLAWASCGRLWGRAPDPLQGLMELRGVGVVSQPCLPVAEAALIVRCADAEDEIDRMPQREVERICDIALPTLRVHALDASAPAKLGRALIHLGQGHGAS